MGWLYRLYDVWPYDIQIKLVQVISYVNPFWDTVHREAGNWKYKDFYLPQRPDLIEIEHINSGYEERMRCKYLAPEYGIVIKEDDKVIDVGAFVGAFTRYAESITDSVIAIEPNPDTYQCLMKNTDSTVMNCAVTDEDSVSLKLGEDSTDDTLLQPDSGTVQDTVTVPGCSLSRFNNIDFLKMDCEGYEPEALATLGDTRPAKIAVDVGAERDGERTEEAVKELLDDYEIHVKGDILFAKRD